MSSTGRTSSIAGGGDAESQSGGNAFRLQWTWPIAAYLTLQNLILAAAIGITTILLYQKNAVEANNMSTSLSVEMVEYYANIQQTLIAKQIVTEILNFTSLPLSALEQSAIAYSSGLMAVSDFEKLHQWFYPEILKFPMATTLAWAEYPSGDNYGISMKRTITNGVETRSYTGQMTNTQSGRNCPAFARTAGSCTVTTGNRTNYPLNPTTNVWTAGTTGKVAYIFDSTKGKAWALFAKDAAVPNIASYQPSVKLSTFMNILTLYYLHPVWTNAVPPVFVGTFEGEMELSITQTMLQSLRPQTTANTQMYIMQRDGILVGTTTGDNLTDYSTTPIKTMDVASIKQGFIWLTQQSLLAHFNVNASSGIPQGAALSSKVLDPATGINYMFRLTPLQDGRTIDWLVVIGAPDTDYIGAILLMREKLSDQLAAHQRKVILIIVALMIGTLAAATAYVFISVIRPLQNLSKGMTKATDFDFSAISDGTFIRSPSHLAEVYWCEKAFYDMTVKFASAFKANRTLQSKPKAGQGSAVAVKKTSSISKDSTPPA